MNSTNNTAMKAYFEQVITKTTVVLEEEGNNKKALFRRGMAYRNIGQLDKAINDLFGAAGFTAGTTNLELVDPAIQRELFLLKRDMQSQKQTQRSD